MQKEKALSGFFRKTLEEFYMKNLMPFFRSIPTVRRTNLTIM